MRGFVDARAGARTRSDPYEKDVSLAETRLQLDLNWYPDRSRLQVQRRTGGDAVTDKVRRRQHEGDQPAFSPLDFADVKLGRQILTWGTGDLLFINDLFPKDWESFFIGRDSEYLKGPSDALKRRRVGVLRL
jgi:hypothetical protein